MSGRAPRQKGDRLERAVVKQLQAAGELKTYGKTSANTRQKIEPLAVFSARTDDTR